MNKHTRNIVEIEDEIDRGFAGSPLLKLGYTTAVWTYLSVVEDYYFNNLVINPQPEGMLRAVIDGLVNATTYPMRVCHLAAERNGETLIAACVDEHYKMATDWFLESQSYLHFCCIFPLFHYGEIDIQIEGSFLRTVGWNEEGFAYEYYDRKGENRSNSARIRPDPEEITGLIRRHTTLRGLGFALNFNPVLVRELVEHLKPMQETRSSLPQGWQFCHFSIDEFNRVFTTIYAMNYGWFLARQMVAASGVLGMAYESALWCPGKNELRNRIVRYTGIHEFKVTKIIEYLTFGTMGIRCPDIAIQPIMDLRNDQYAMSSAVWLNSNWERNLCVLMNQIPEERNIYSRLVNAKELLLRNQIIAKLSESDLVFKFGNVAGTDLDLAVVDPANRICLIIELKWMIEPAEIREVIQRSQEIDKGVSQVKKIINLFNNQNDHLVNDVLDIDFEYEIMGVVGSVNFIGTLGVQDIDTPVVRCWHLVEKILEANNLREVLSWLRNREYLPEVDNDYKVVSIPIQIGKWSSEWYGIEPLVPDIEVGLKTGH